MPSEAKLMMPKETEAQKELRLKREKLLEIKAKLAEPGGHFGVGIFSKTGHSYNKFATKPYEELKQIQKKENKFRKIMGLKANKKPVNNHLTKFDDKEGHGFQPQIDPRVLEHGLKQKRERTTEGASST